MIEVFRSIQQLEQNAETKVSFLKQNTNLFLFEAVDCYHS